MKMRSMERRTLAAPAVVAPTLTVDRCPAKALC
jgi:hypothetical protein